MSGGRSHARLRQVLFATLIIATAFLTWTYTSDSPPWQSAAFVYEALASVGDPVLTTLDVTPSPDATGNRQGPAKAVMSVSSAWYGYSQTLQLTFKVTDLGTSQVIAQGQTPESTNPASLTVEVALPVAAGQTKTYRIERSGVVTDYMIPREHRPPPVDVVVYAPTEPAVSSSITIAPAANATGARLSPATVTLGVTSTLHPAYPPTLSYRVFDSASALVAEGTTASQTTLTLTALPGTTKTYRILRSASAATPVKTYSEQPADETVTVYRPAFSVKLGRPTVPTKSRSTVKTKIAGTIAPARTVGATNVVKVKLYRWEKPRRSTKATWVYKKSVWAKITKSNGYTAYSKLSKGSWTAIATARASTAYKAAKSTRSKTVVVR